MDSASIGIKLADNKFFPIMDDGVEGSKTLELTTVNENQESVQIHLYRSKESSLDQTIDNAEYIGTIIIEYIAKKPAGMPTIKLKISLNSAGDLSAEALDVDSGTHQSLNVSLKDLSKETFEPLPDFDITGVDTDIDTDSASEALDLSDLDDIGLEIENYPDAADDAAPSFGEEIKENTEVASADTSFDDISSIEDVSFSDTIDFPDSAPDFESSDSDFDSDRTETPEPPVAESLYDSSEAQRAKERKGVFVPAWACVLILVLGIALLAAALIFAWKLFGDDGQTRQRPVAARPAAASESAPPVPEQEPSVAPAEEEPTPPPVWQEDAAVAAAEPEPPAPPAPAPASQNVYYLIKWGDTLWDLAETYYRNPWRYSYIARYNSIRNPSLIIAGTYLVIPAE